MVGESLPFSVSLDLALEGAGACRRSSFASALVAANDALDWLREQHATKSLELLSSISRIDDLVAAQAVADTLRKDTSRIVVLGIGGSSLGGQALKALS